MIPAAVDLRPPAGAQAARRYTIPRTSGSPRPSNLPEGTKSSAKLARCRLGAGHASTPVSEATFSLKLPASLVRPNAQAERPAEPGRSSLLLGC